MIRRFAIVVLLGTVASFLTLEGQQAASPVDATFPGDNGRIVFVRGDAAGIYSMNPDGSDVRQLTNGPDQYPAWSADSRIAYVRATQDQAEIWVMNGDGSGQRRVTSGSYDWWPAWSPDGTQIAFLRQPDTAFAARQVHVVASDGRSQPVKTPSDQDDEHAFCCVDWSPDESRIAFGGRFLFGTQYRGGVWSVAPDGSGRTLLVPSDEQHVYNVGGISWSPDGSRLLVKGNGPTLPSEGLWITDLNGNPSQNLTPDEPGVTGYFSWSPDGSQVVYATGPEGIRVVPATGGTPVTIHPNAGSPDWGPSPTLLKVEFTQGIQELQEVANLEDDLDLDGKPPVPIVANKPLAMRIYFDEVDQPTSYNLQVTGGGANSAVVNLVPGCDIEQRRRQENNCKSVDFYSTPPEGDWSVTLEVRDPNGNLVKDYDYNFTSEESAGIVLKAVSVCDSRTPGFFGVWSCEGAKKLGRLVELLRKIAPTDSVTVLYTGNQVRYDMADYMDPDDWWDDVVEDIDAMHGLVDTLTTAVTGDEIYYYGMARPSIPGANGLASSIPGRGAFSKSVTSSGAATTVAHETGHLMGRKHTAVALPDPQCWQSKSSSTDWPYADNFLRSGPTVEDIEVGFDVAAGKALPGDENFEIMGYCDDRWISPHTAVNLLKPAGPLRMPAGKPPSETGPFWFVAGEIAGGAVQFEPLFAYETEAATDPGSGSHRIEVQDAGGAPLFTRAFTPVSASPDLPPEGEERESDPFFAELVPVEVGAARIAVFEGDTELGAITLAGAAPTVTITAPAGGAAADDELTVAWDAEDADSTEHTYWVDYSPDGGETWLNLGMGLPDIELVVSGADLPGSDEALVRVLASDGANTGQAVSAQFSVARKPPEGEIVEPLGGTFRLGGLVWLQAIAFDPDDGFLDGGAIEWVSSRDGALGTSASLPVYDLSLGQHTITMTARDSDNNVVTDSITVIVFDAPITEGEPDVLSGDVDCSGVVNSIDALKVSRYVAGLEVSQTEPCPDIGTGDAAIFGDVSCDGNITAVDALFVLRFVAALPVNLPQGCRPLGT